MIGSKYYNYLTTKYQNTFENKWFWIILLLAIMAFAAYAFYCTRQGFDFAGHVKLNYPRVWEMSIGCSK